MSIIIIMSILHIIKKNESQHHGVTG